MFVMAKTTSINLRISPEFRHEIEILAEYHGLTMSSFAHSVLVKAIRAEKNDRPELFEKHEHFMTTSTSVPSLKHPVDVGKRKTKTG